MFAGQQPCSLSGNQQITSEGNDGDQLIIDRRHCQQRGIGRSAPEPRRCVDSRHCEERDRQPDNVKIQRKSVQQQGQFAPVIACQGRIVRKNSKDVHHQFARFFADARSVVANDPQSDFQRLGMLIGRS